MSTLSTKKYFERNLRIDHRWIAIIIMIPILITTITGTLLLMRNQISWIQPQTLKRDRSEQWATIDQVFDAIRHEPKTHIQSWKEISSIIYKASKGTIQIRTKNKQLIQLDGTSAEILSIAPRRTGWLIQLHEGTYWGKGVRLYVFLPAALGLILLIISGGILTFKHYKRRIITYKNHA